MILTSTVAIIGVFAAATILTFAVATALTFVMGMALTLVMGMQHQEREKVVYCWYQLFVQKRSLFMGGYAHAMGGCS